MSKFREKESGATFYMLRSLSNPTIFNEIAKDAFKVADKDNNGYIDKDEFKECMKCVSDFFGNSSNDKNYIDEFQKLDLDNNGVIDFDEFIIFVKDILDKLLF